jgi:C4-dicarboxylate-specific signal transduction histidine kinase
VIDPRTCGLFRVRSYVSTYSDPSRDHPFTLEEDRAATKARIAESREGQRRDYRIEKRLLRKDGTVIWTDISAVFVTTTRSVPAFFAVVIVDITDRKRAEEEIKRIRRLEGEMRQASRTEMMGGLTASLAHELNQHRCSGPD